MKKRGKKKETDAIDEVEELLKLTQDDLLLNLTVNSHTISKSKTEILPESSYSNAVDPDLDRRFQALRSKPNSELTADDLFARFAALKAPNATPASNSTTGPVKIVKQEADEDEEDEVQKIIDWAVDAARLDPSPPTDSDNDDDDDDDYEDDDDSDDDEVASRKKKGSKR